nr:hypothetical protein CFP56_52265 [Quercus suber]
MTETQELSGGKSRLHGHGHRRLHYGTRTMQRGTQQFGGFRSRHDQVRTLANGPVDRAMLTSCTPQPDLVQLQIIVPVQHSNPSLPVQAPNEDQAREHQGHDCLTSASGRFLGKPTNPPKEHS